jgi:hypothetical protein
METNIANQNIRPYLLGTLAEAEQQRLEESLLTSDELFEELLVVEDELIDEYLAGQLTESDRERFEQHFLSTPERLQKLSFARALKKHINAAASRESPASNADDAPPSSWKRWLPTFLRTQNPVLNFSLATALLVLVVGGLWVINLSYRGSQVATNGGPSSSNFVAVTLTPGLVRDAGEMKRVVIPTSVDAVQLRLELATTDYESYRAMLQTDEGREIFTADKLKAETTASGKIVLLNVPAKLLNQSDYRVKLSGITADGNLENISSYYFRVVKS